MKYGLITVLSIGIISFSSCKKEAAVNVHQESSVEVVAAGESYVSPWAVVSGWNVNAEDEVSGYSAGIPEKSITPTVSESALILVYVKDGATPQLLPFTDKTNTDWYYQVSEGNIALVGQNAGGTVTVANNRQFAYVVIPHEELTDLEAKGSLKSDLMNMNYDALIGLLKK